MSAYIIDLDKVSKEYNQFRQSQTYEYRRKQRLFVTDVAQPVLGKFIEKSSISNTELNSLIRIFAENCAENTFEVKLKSLDLGNEFTDKIISKFKQINQRGYTNDPISKITLKNEDLQSILNFLKETYSSNTEDEIKQAVKRFMELGVLFVREGRFSPWLHYMHPNVCPIINNVTKNYFKSIGLKDISFFVVWDLIKEIKEKVGEEDLGFIDYFFYLMNKKVDLPGSNFDDLFENIYKFVEQSQTTEQKTRDYIKQYNGLDVSISFGTGIATKVPWICFLKKGEIVQQGYYPSLYYDKDISVLFVVMGVSETNEPINTWSIDYAKNYPTFRESSLSQNVMERFPNSRIFSKYPIDKENIKASLTNEKENIKKDLGELIRIYTIGNNYRLLNSELSLIAKKKQIILYGPPGTGKTFNTKNLAVQVIHKG